MSESDSSFDIPKNPFQEADGNGNDDDLLAKSFHDKATIEVLDDDAEEDEEEVDPEQYKQQGNAAYIAKDFTSALNYYDQAIQCCSRQRSSQKSASDSANDSSQNTDASKGGSWSEPLHASSSSQSAAADNESAPDDKSDPHPDTDAPKHDPRLAIYHGNRSACFMMLEQYEDAIEACSASLRINPKYVKVLMRRAKAYEETEKFMSAAADLESVLKIDENYAPARANLVRIQPRAKKEQDEMQAKVMGQLKDLGNTVLGKFGMSLDNFQAVKDPNTGSYSISYKS